MIHHDKRKTIKANLGLNCIIETETKLSSSTISRQKERGYACDKGFSQTGNRFISKHMEKEYFAVQSNTTDIKL